MSTQRKLVSLVALTCIVVGSTACEEEPTPEPRYTAVLVGPPPPLPGEPGFSIPGGEGDGPFGDATPTGAEPVWEEYWPHDINDSGQVAGLARAADGRRGAWRFSHPPGSWQLHEFPPSGPQPAEDIEPTGRDWLRLDDAGTLYVQSFSDDGSDRVHSLTFGAQPFPGNTLTDVADFPDDVYLMEALGDGTLLLLFRTPDEDAEGYTLGDVENTIRRPDGQFEFLFDGPPTGLALNAHDLVFGTTLEFPEFWPVPDTWTWQQGQFTDAPEELWELSSSARLNDSGVVLTHIKLWDPPEVRSLEAELASEDIWSAQLTGLNNASQVVGWGRDHFDLAAGESAPIVAVLIDGPDIYRLDEHVTTPGVTVTHAIDINDAGWIAAMGLVNGQPHALLLIPEDDA